MMSSRALPTERRRTDSTRPATQDWPATVCTRRLPRWALTLVYRAAHGIAARADGKFSGETVHSIDPQLPLSQMQTMEHAMFDSEAPRRFSTAIISTFAVSAILVAMLGIYGVVASSVASRTQEMAIRMALGAHRSGILTMVLTSGAELAAVGCVLGLVGAAVFSQVLRSLLFGVGPFDPIVLISSAVAVLLLALAASAVPARRAASVDPMRALRME